MKLKFFFDYIYYRVTKAYFKWDGRTGITAIFSVTAIQVFPLIVISLYLTVNILDDGLTQKYMAFISLILAAIFLGIAALNYRKYNGKYNPLRRYWQNETDKQKNIRGLFVILVIIASLLTAVLLNVLPPFGPYLFDK